MNIKQFRYNADNLGYLVYGDTSAIDIDGENIQVFHTPGHTSDSVCFYYDHVLISGDTLFNGKVGRCFTGDYNEFLQSIKTLLALHCETVVYAGHDYVEEYMAFAHKTKKVCSVKL